jgi:hypothetical protein
MYMHQKVYNIVLSGSKLYVQFMDLAWFLRSLFSDSFSPAHIHGLRVVAQNLEYLELHGVNLNLKIMGTVAVFPKLLRLTLSGQHASGYNPDWDTAVPLKLAFPLLEVIAIHVRPHPPG